MAIIMEINITIWMNEYINKLKALFGSRLLFSGLQGSYGRNEATESSDIDVVVILDHATPEDLKAYSVMLDSLPHREKICGFFSGRQELINWERSDLFQFYYDTTPVFGSINFLLPLISKDDIYRTIRIGACNIYHMCGHNIIYEKDSEILISLYKSAAFTVQAIYFKQTGTYIKQKAEFLPLLNPQEREVLQNTILLKQHPDIAKTEFDRLSALLFQWSGGLIIEYNADKKQQGN